MANSERGSNRWVIVVAGIIIQLCLGTLYAYSVFRNPLINEFGWTVTETSLAFTISLVFFTLGVIAAGRWQDKVGPRKVATIGGILLGLGCIMARQTETLLMLYISYGVVAGSGVGFAYVTPIATIVKWFPDKRGLMTGLAVFGFGAGSLVFAPLAALLIIDYGVLNTFAILGVIFLVAVVGSAQLLRNPPAGWKPKGWDLSKINTQGSSDFSSVQKEFTPGEMLKTMQFWLMWIVYVIGAAAGLMIISQASPMGQEMSGLTREAAAAAVGVLAVFNGLGRIFWGALSDKVGRDKALILMFGLYAVSLFAILPSVFNYLSFVAGVSAVALSFGGFLALMPALTADSFGVKNLGINYGFMFTAYGAASIFGPLLIAQVRELTGGYMIALYALGALSLIGIGLTYINKMAQLRTSQHPVKVD